MRFGIRKPNLKKQLKSRTTAKWKRQAKSKFVPLYGKKGIGYLKNPKRALYNKVYRKTSFSIWDLFK